ncbi:MAG: hypothetical protein ABSD44_08535 [Terracidiphilus sp.]
MDDVIQQARMYVLAAEMKKYYHQRNVYRTVLALIKRSGVPGVDELIDATLQDSDLQKLTDHDFAFLDKWLPPILQVDFEKVQRDWLEGWKPERENPN